MGSRGAKVVAILAANGRLAEPGNAAAAGERIVISCAGLGQVSLPVAAGFASPENAATVNAVTVTIGGANAPVSFAGLISGSAGMYQVIAAVPQGAGRRPRRGAVDGSRSNQSSRKRWRCAEQCEAGDSPGHARRYQFRPL